jgi:hypothetical protein
MEGCWSRNSNTIRNALAVWRWHTSNFPILTTSKLVTRIQIGSLAFEIGDPSRAVVAIVEWGRSLRVCYPPSCAEIGTGIRQ